MRVKLEHDNQESDCQCDPEVRERMYAFLPPNNKDTSSSETKPNSQVVLGKDLNFLTTKPLENPRINNMKVISTDALSGSGILWSSFPNSNQSSLSAYRYGISNYGLFCPIPGQYEEKINSNINTIRSTKAFEPVGSAILTQTPQVKKQKKFEQGFIIPKSTPAKN